MPNRSVGAEFQSLFGEKVSNTNKNYMPEIDFHKVKLQIWFRNVINVIDARLKKHQVKKKGGIMEWYAISADPNKNLYDEQNA